MAFASVQRASVVDAFEELQDFADAEMGPILDYFEDTYIGRKRRRNRAPPKYAHGLWNVEERLVDGLPRTNNAVEGWHRHMQSAVACQHPNLWKFLQVLKKEQGVNNLLIAQANAGVAPPKQRKVYEDVTRRLTTIAQDFANRNVVDYLRGIAMNISV